MQRHQKAMARGRWKDAKVEVAVVVLFVWGMQENEACNLVLGHQVVALPKIRPSRVRVYVVSAATAYRGER